MSEKVSGRRTGSINIGHQEGDAFHTGRLHEKELYPAFVGIGVVSGRRRQSQISSCIVRKGDRGLAHIVMADATQNAEGGRRVEAGIAARCRKYCGYII